LVLTSFEYNGIWLARLPKGINNLISPRLVSHFLPWSYLSSRKLSFVCFQLQGLLFIFNADTLLQTGMSHFMELEAPLHKEITNVTQWDKFQFFKAKQEVLTALAFPFQILFRTWVSCHSDGKIDSPEVILNHSRDNGWLMEKQISF